MKEVIVLVYVFKINVFSRCIVWFLIKYIIMGLIVIVMLYIGILRGKGFERRNIERDFVLEVYLDELLVIVFIFNV